jgi:hypothetical protein
MSSTGDKAVARPRVHDVGAQPVAAQRGDARLSERRNAAERAAVRSRIQDEFEEMPGLSPTPAQAARLFGIPTAACARVCQELSRAGVLRLAADGRYLRRTGERLEPTPFPSFLKDDDQALTR